MDKKELLEFQSLRLKFKESGIKPDDIQSMVLIVFSVTMPIIWLRWRLIRKWGG